MLATWNSNGNRAKFRCKRKSIIYEQTQRINAIKTRRMHSNIIGSINVAESSSRAACARKRNRLDKLSGQVSAYSLVCKAIFCTLNLLLFPNIIIYSLFLIAFRIRASRMAVWPLSSRQSPPADQPNRFSHGSSKIFTRIGASDRQTFILDGVVMEAKMGHIK